MSTLVSFYALPDEAQTAPQQNSVPNEIGFIAKLISDFVTARKKVSVICESQIQAEQLDEYLWQFPADKFVPHNLFGEGPDMGTPVLIMWDAIYQKNTQLRNKNVVISLSQTLFDKINGIGQIIDFVPPLEEQKILARNRYKAYKQAGFQLEYITV